MSVTAVVRSPIGTHDLIAAALGKRYAKGVYRSVRQCIELIQRCTTKEEFLAGLRLLLEQTSGPHTARFRLARAKIIGMCARNMASRTQAAIRCLSRTVSTADQSRSFRTAKMKVRFHVKPQYRHRDRTSPVFRLIPQNPPRCFRACPLAPLMTGARWISDVPPEADWPLAHTT